MNGPITKRAQTASPAGGLRNTLEAGLCHLDLALKPDQIDQLLNYLALLQKWNRVYNLTAVREPSSMLTHHLLDSLAVVKPLLNQIGNQSPCRLLDVGSGGGLPGVVLALSCPQIQVTCVDTVAKKAAFIQQVSHQLALPNLKGLHQRVEQIEAHPAKGFEVICSRAFASLNDFTRWSERALLPGGIWMAMKGKMPADELPALSPGLAVFHVEPLQVPGLEAERCLLWLRRNGDMPALRDSAFAPASHVN